MFNCPNIFLKWLVIDCYENKESKSEKKETSICNKEHGQMTRQTKAKNIVHNTETSYYRNFWFFTHLDYFSITSLIGAFVLAQNYLLNNISSTCYKNNYCYTELIRISRQFAQCLLRF